MTLLLQNKCLQDACNAIAFVTETLLRKLSLLKQIITALLKFSPYKLFTLLGQNNNRDYADLFFGRQNKQGVVVLVGAVCNRTIRVESALCGL